MTTKLRALFLALIRLIVVWLVDGLSLYGMAALLPGMHIESSPLASAWTVALAAALVLGVVNFTIRPILLLLTLPFGFIAVLLSGFVINGLTLWLSAGLLPAFQIYNLWTALLGGFVFALINTLLTNLITIDDDDSFFQNLVEQRARRQQIFPDAHDPSQGLLMIEIDGLSYHHLQKALHDGYMPTVSRLIREQGYKIHRVETGIPSMTSACQAGILYGDNYDIPSFRWYDRSLNRFIVSQMDAAMLDQRFSKGQGLARGGSSIANMLNGDALKSQFVIATFRNAPPEERKLRARDLYLLMLDPYFFLRSIILFFGDALMEVFQYLLQIVRNVQPRLNRLHNGYPLMRAALTSFLKDISAYLILLDVLRGTPALYHTYAGYDEMAHHAGPWTWDAFRELRRLDRMIARLLAVIGEKAPRPYELILLSDHGQSFGFTFLQRYGQTLGDFIQSQLPQGAQVAASASSDDGSTGVISMMDELSNIEDQSVGGAAGRAVLQGANRLLRRGVDQRLGAADNAPAEVKVAFSGNLANVYFTNLDHRPRVSELNARYPGLLDALVQHEGVGFVVGLNDDDQPVCFGKGGACNLHSGAATGENPLTPFTCEYAPLDLRLEQVRRVADFPHAGDLIVNSPLYPDGTVAAYEELIGNHGGLGGEQTDAFILAPADVPVPPTRNSIDVYAILNARRGLIPAAPAPGAAAAAAASDWSLRNLWAGLAQVELWFSRALRMLVFDRRAYAEIAADRLMTGPALLIGLLAAALQTWDLRERPYWALIYLAMMFVSAALTWLAGRLLKSKQDFTPLIRSLLFARISSLWLLLGLIPSGEGVASLIAALVGFLTSWLAATTALKLKGWKTIILPFSSFFLAVFLTYAIAALLWSTAFTIEALSRQFGLQ